MFHRRMQAPDRSFFLFGPRGTGKSTWLHTKFGAASWYDLLDGVIWMRLARDPGTFAREVQALPQGAWVVVDEVQRLPALLDEVHGLMTRHPRRWRFALTGSSARKLHRGGANLLAGRSVNRRFFPLVVDELGTAPEVDDLLKYGGLPGVRIEGAARDRVEVLDAYVQNYLEQEIRADAAVKRLDAFVRFLQVAALSNAQVTNVSAIARDAGVARPTVQGYFETLVDTLLGVWLPAWRPRAKIKETAHPKFYLFDPGVARALAGRHRDPMDAIERGALLETWILHELRAWIDMAGVGGELSYWRTPSGREVDFVWRRGDRAVGIEVKSATRWRSGDGAALAEMLEERTIGRAWGVYLGERPQRDGQIEVLPFATFLARLTAGEILRV